jgi:hypothetical protein
MLHYTVELQGGVVAEVCNPDLAIIFSKGGEEFLRLSFPEFDQILEAMARCEKFGEDTYA